MYHVSSSLPFIYSFYMYLFARRCRVVCRSERQHLYLKPNMLCRAAPALMQRLSHVEILRRGIADLVSFSLRDLSHGLAAGP